MCIILNKKTVFVYNKQHCLQVTTIARCNVQTKLGLRIGEILMVGAIRSSRREDLKEGEGLYQNGYKTV